MAKNAIAASDAAKQGIVGKAVVYGVMAAVDGITAILDGVSVVLDFVFPPPITNHRSCKYDFASHKYNSGFLC